MGYLEQQAGLDGKVAVVVGGAGGLGEASTMALARAGMDIAVIDRDEAKLTERVDEIGALGRQVVSRLGDARKPEVLDEFFAEITSTFGKVDAYVYCIGGSFWSSFMDSTPAGWDAVMRQNFTGALHSTQRVVPLMRNAGGGSIIYVTSIEGHRAAPGVAVYAAMKAALTNFAWTLAAELGRDNIRVNTIAPDLFPTPGMTEMLKAGRSDEEFASYQQLSAKGYTISIPLQRTGSYDEFGGAVMFLASNLSNNMTGSTIHLDGGCLNNSSWFNWGKATGTPHVPASIVKLLPDEFIGPK